MPVMPVWQVVLTWSNIWESKATCSTASGVYERESGRLLHSLSACVSTFNWTPVMVGLILGAVLLVWFLPRYGAQYWYHGRAHLLPDTSVVSSSLLTPAQGRPCTVM